MTTTTTAVTAAAAALLLFAFTDGGAQQATGSFSRTLDLDGPISLDVVTGSGSIEIRRGNTGEAKVDGRIRVHRGFGWGRSDAEAEDLVRRLEAQPPVELNGDTLRVGLRDRDDDLRNVSISYRIEVPADTRVSSRSGSGSQHVTGIDAPVGVSAGSGGIALTDIGAPANARTGSGSVEAARIAGEFTARSGSGSITLTQSAPGDVRIDTGSGSARVEGVEGALHVRTGSGSIEAKGVPLGLWDLTAGSGSITLDLPEDAGFEIEARAGSGSISLDHPVRGRIQRGRVDGIVGDGGPMLELRTGSGSIRIR